MSVIRWPALVTEAMIGLLRDGEIVKNPVRPLIHDILEHLCSSISYGGATSLADLTHKFRADPLRYLIKLSASARRESYDR